MKMILLFFSWRISSYPWFFQYLADLRIQEILRTRGRTFQEKFCNIFQPSFSKPQTLRQRPWHFFEKALPFLSLRERIPDQRKWVYISEKGNLGQILRFRAQFSHSPSKTIWTSLIIFGPWVGKWGHDKGGSFYSKCGRKLLRVLSPQDTLAGWGLKWSFWGCAWNRFCRWGWGGETDQSGGS